MVRIGPWNKPGKARNKVGSYAANAASASCDTTRSIPGETNPSNVGTLISAIVTFKPDTSNSVMVAKKHGKIFLVDKIDPNMMFSNLV